MAVISPNKFGIAMLEALGVDPSHVTEFVIRSNYWDVPTVEVTYFVDDSQLGMVEVVRQYELAPKSGDEA